MAAPVRNTTRDGGACVDVVWCPRPDAEPVDVRLTMPAGATIGDVLDALGSSSACLVVDHRRVEPGTAAADAGVVRGSLLATAPDHRSPPAGHGTFELVVVAGLLAGRRYPLHTGPYVIGRSDACDIKVAAPSVSARHVRLSVDTTGEITVEDLASTNGTWVDRVFAHAPTVVPDGAVVRMGAVTFQVQRRVPAVGLTTRRADGTAAFNRPPRITTGPASAVIVAPAAPPEPGPRARVPWAALIAPLVLGIAMAVLYDPRFAAFALFSPAMMLGTWAEDRRRARRDAATDRSSLDQALEQLRVEIAAAANAEQRRRRGATPTAGLAAAVAAGPSPRLWERRPEHPDFLQLALGLGELPWRPLTSGDHHRVAPEAERLLTQASVVDVPVVVDLRPGSTCGFSGNRAVAAAVARNLVVQVAALHGPADVRLAIFTAADRVAEWEWAKWLPHTVGESLGLPLIAATPDDHQRVAEAIGAHGTTTVVVVDHEPLLRGRNAAVRGLLATDGVCGIVLAADGTALPAVCTTVVTCADDQGLAQCSVPNVPPAQVLLAGTEIDVCRGVAHQLARADDPERGDATEGLPDRVSLLDLLSLEFGTPQELLDRWSAGSEPRVVIGVGEDGPLELDLVADGPHGLIAGTTGAGKSELLRSIVAGLAANLSPQDLNFVLIDYKGGSAFDACAALPHTVGMVTDLDEALGRRALRCLEAELRYRERTLRVAGAVDLKAYRSLPGGPPHPLPRLLVAVDEFATLAAEMPDFIDKLVSVAQRGRSLGVHLLLATQRPAGAVSDHIRANTNMRIALRLHDAADSCDVIGVPDAAGLHRGYPGRGYMRLGPSDLTAFQAALVSAPPVRAVATVTAERFTLTTGSAAQAQPEGTETPSDLQRLVATACAAFEATGLPAPRRPWPEPLPTAVALDEAQADHGEAVIGIVDDPDHQRRLPLHFDPRDGALALYGALASGPTRTLETIVTSLARQPNVHCYVVDAGTQALTGLDQLPHVGTVIRAGDRERQERLVHYLVDEIAARRGRIAGGERLDDEPSVVVAIDNYAAFSAGFDDLAGLALLDELARVIADGPALGVTVAMTADRLNAIPPAVAATIPRRLLFALPDRCDYAQFGVTVTEELPRNRAIDVASGLFVQIADPPDDIAPVPVNDGGAVACPPPRPIDVLPVNVPVAAIADAAARVGDEWHLPIGLDDRALQPTGWVLGPGDHALVTGPARSGKSTSLAVVAELLAKLGTDVRVYGTALRRSSLRDSPYLEGLATTAAEFDEQVRTIAAGWEPAMLLLDDADALPDSDGLLAALLAERRDNLWVVAAGRADLLRTMYGHFTAELRRSRCGLALRPNVDLDGDLWHTPLPRRQQRPFTAGRGYLISDGEAALVQGATL